MKRTYLKRGNKPSRRKSKNPAVVLIKKCSTLAKLIARKLKNFTCEYCERQEPDIQTHGSHIYNEGVHESMCADVDNILCLCATHHMAAGYWNRADHWSWHNSPAEAMDWFREKYPERAEILKLRAREIKTCDLIFWEKKWIELKAIEESLPNNL